jgi:hypothetical protein
VRLLIFASNKIGFGYVKNNALLLIVLIGQKNNIQGDFSFYFLKELKGLIGFCEVLVESSLQSVLQYIIFTSKLGVRKIKFTPRIDIFSIPDHRSPPNNINIFATRKAENINHSFILHFRFTREFQKIMKEKKRSEYYLNIGHL